MWRFDFGAFTTVLLLALWHSAEAVLEVVWGICNQENGTNLHVAIYAIELLSHIPDFELRNASDAMV